MRPQDALSPRDRLKSLNVIVETETWSLAEFVWREGDAPYDNDSSWSKTIGCRWNGDKENDNDKGNPRSHNQGTWFILPEPIANLVKASLAPSLTLTSEK